jgi:hypothetical protein
MTEIKYAHWEHLPVRFRGQEAWLFSMRTLQWVPLHPAEAHCKAALLTREEFEDMYPDLPPLPIEAFRSPR